MPAVRAFSPGSRSDRVVQYPVPRSTVSRLIFAGALVPWGIGGPRSLALEAVEDAGRVPALLRSLAPVVGRQGAVLLPGPAVDGQVTLSVARDPQEADRRRLVL